VAFKLRAIQLHHLIQYNDITSCLHHVTLKLTHPDETWRKVHVMGLMGPLQYASREGKMMVVIDHMCAFILVEKLHTFITYCNALMTKYRFWFDKLIYLKLIIFNYK
jgi:hypothetical protein